MKRELDNDSIDIISILESKRARSALDENNSMMMMMMMMMMMFLVFLSSWDGGRENGHVGCMRDPHLRGGSRRIPKPPRGRLGGCVCAAFWQRKGVFVVVS
jgi:hypothetical protein